MKPHGAEKATLLEMNLSMDRQIEHLSDHCEIPLFKNKYQHFSSKSLLKAIL